jgi:phage-related protein
LKTLREFPEEVQQDVGHSLMVVQAGLTPSDAKPLKGIGSGVLEIVTRHVGDTYRTVYAVQIADRVYVLHVFQKKSKHGRATPKAEIDLIKNRYRQALEREKSR